MNIIPKDNITSDLTIDEQSYGEALEPNLFIIGSQKSGTTSLHNYLDMHPHIFMSKEKEPGFFVEEIAWSKGLEWYKSLFEHASSSHKYIGESSTHYTKLPTFKEVPQKIHQFNPNAKLIYIIRHPFERLVSHYWHEVRTLHHGGLIGDIYSVCTKDERFKAYSNYPMQLNSWLEYFPPSSIKIIVFEELLANPQQQLDNLFEWLNISKSVDLQSSATAFNAKPDVIVGVSGKGMLNKVARSQLWGKLSPYAPKTLKRWAANKSKKVIDEQKMLDKIDILKKELYPEMAEQTKILSAMINRDLNQIWRFEIRGRS